MIKLSPRLMAAVPYVRAGHLLADIGTDHAYLPIYLCQTKKLSPIVAKNGETLYAVASDINKGPVERATLHIVAEGQAGKIKTLCTNGLQGIDIYDPQDIVIFGMGGELILSILQDAPWVRKEGTRLIMQPMTHPERLRYGLAELGFAIKAESLVIEGDRMYQIICADYDPPNAAMPSSVAEAWTGHLYTAEQIKLHQKLIQKIMAKEQNCRRARNLAGQDTSEEDALIASLTAQLQAITHT